MTDCSTNGRGTEAAPRKRALGAFVESITLLACALCLGACASPQQYMGIPLSAGAADSELQALARKAEGGDKSAQFQLATYYQYASYGRDADIAYLFSDLGRPEDERLVSAVLDIELPPGDIARIGSPWLVYMTRARALLEMAAADTGGERRQIIPLASGGGAVSSTIFSTGPLQKGSSDAAARLIVVNTAISRQKYVTHFNSPYSESCESEYYRFADWLRDAHFVVEGSLATKYIDASDIADDVGNGEKRARHHLEGQHYVAEIKIRRFLKWPTEIQKPSILTIEDHVTFGARPPGHSEGFYGCSTWAPSRDPLDLDSIIILQYSNDPFGIDKFHIVNVFPGDSIN